jgi:hypothetical protein
MLNQQTIEKLHALKLPGMAEAFKDQLPQPDIQRLSFDERFGLIVDRQWDWKENHRLQRYLKEAKLKLNACVEDIDYQTPRGIQKEETSWKSLKTDTETHRPSSPVSCRSRTGMSILGILLSPMPSSTA